MPDSSKRKSFFSVRNPYWIALLSYPVAVFACSLSNELMGLLHDGTGSVPNPFGFAVAFAFGVLVLLKFLPPDAGSNDRV